MEQKTALDWLIEKLDANLDINHSWRTRQYIEQAKQMEKEQSHLYVEFAIRCDRKNMKILNFEDWIKLETLKLNNMEKSNYTGTIAKIEQREGYWVLILTNGLSGHLPSPYARTEEHLDLIKMEVGMKITYDYTNNTFNKIIVC